MRDLWLDRPMTTQPAPTHKDWETARYLRTAADHQVRAAVLRKDFPAAERYAREAQRHDDHMDELAAALDAEPEGEL